MNFFEDENVAVFFGDKTSLQEVVAARFPQFRLISVRQTHSDIVAPSPFEGEPPEADAHFTRQAGLALCIRTADCIPVMIYDRASGTVAAIHAGWRGVENEIIAKTLRKISPSSQTRAWIGPHIGSRSFEVGADVAQKLDAVFQKYSKGTSLLAHGDPAKARVDLLKIARAQLSSFGIEDVSEFATDTFVSESHASFRRDRDQAGRQISFIALKSQER